MWEHDVAVLQLFHPQNPNPDPFLTHVKALRWDTTTDPLGSLSSSQKPKLKRCLLRMHAVLEAEKAYEDMKWTAEIIQRLFPMSGREGIKEERERHVMRREREYLGPTSK